MWLALVLVVGNALTFSFESEAACDLFSEINVAYWNESQQVPSYVLCMEVKEI